MNRTTVVGIFLVGFVVGMLAGCPKTQKQEQQDVSFSEGRVEIVADKERGVVCYVYQERGISCVFDPTADLIIPQQEEEDHAAFAL